MNPKVSIVTVNWGTYEQTCGFSESLLNQTYANFEIVVVNNSPEENGLFGSWEKSKKIHVVNTGKNLGYSGGLNAGMKYALEKLEADYLLLTNNDVEVSKNLIRDFLSVADDETIYAPLILKRNTGVVQNTGGKLSIVVGGTINLNKDRNISKIKKIDPDFLSGCMLFLHKNVVERIGYFDERFGSYYEDVDYCIRAKDQGISLKILWDLKIRHFHSMSTRGKCGYKIYLITRNSLLFARKHLEGIKKLIFIFSSISRGFVQYLFNNFRFYLKGVKEGLKC